MVYKVTADFPREELFGLRNQLRRTSVDIAAFIAEGCGKPSDEEFAKCIGSALGYANRMEYFALVAFDLKLLEQKPYDLLHERIIETSKMLSAFWQTLRRNGRNSIDN